MALLPTKQSDQIKVLIIMLALGLAGLFWYFVYDPKSADLDKLALHVDSLEKANNAAKNTMAAGDVNKIREQAQESRANLELMRTLVPAANEVSNLIDQVSSAARRAHLDIGALEPEPVIEGEMFDTYRYRMRMNGSYHDIAQMLTNIGSLNRIATTLNLNLQLAAGTAPPGKQLLASTFELQTYVIRTSARGKPQDKKPAAAGAPPAASPSAPPGATPPGAPTTKKPGGGGI